MRCLPHQVAQWLRSRQCRRCKGRGFDPCVGTIPWRRKWQPAPVFLPGKSHGQRSLGGYSPWGHKESDMTERLSTHTPLLCSNQHLMPSTHLLQPPCPQSPSEKKDDISPTIIIPGVSWLDHSCPLCSPSTVGPALNPGKLQMSNCCIYSFTFAQDCPLVVKHRRERGQEEPGVGKRGKKGLQRKTHVRSPSLGKAPSKSNSKPRHRKSKELSKAPETPPYPHWGGLEIGGS